jgi:hypothetical protein
VVLPASMWAMMPKVRERSMGVVRATSSILKNESGYMGYPRADYQR